MNSPNSFLQETQLSGKHVQLVPLSMVHHDALIEAVKDGELWRHWYTFIPTPEKMADEISRRLSLHQQGSMLPLHSFARRQGCGHDHLHEH